MLFDRILNTSGCFNDRYRLEQSGRFARPSLLFPVPASYLLRRLPIRDGKLRSRYKDFDATRWLSTFIQKTKKVRDPYGVRYCYRCFQPMVRIAGNKENGHSSSSASSIPRGKPASFVRARLVTKSRNPPKETQPKADEASSSSSSSSLQISRYCHLTPLLQTFCAKV